MTFNKKNVDMFFNGAVIIKHVTIGTFETYVDENYDGGGIRVLNRLMDTNTFFVYGSANSKNGPSLIDKNHLCHQQIVECLIARKLTE